MLETLEGYTFTAAIAPGIVEAVASAAVAGTLPTGATTAVNAFGTKLALSLPATQIMDLPTN